MAHMFEDEEAFKRSDQWLHTAQESCNSYRITAVLPIREAKSGRQRGPSRQRQGDYPRLEAARVGRLGRKSSYKGVE
jgi:hypothetical protein